MIRLHNSDNIALLLRLYLSRIGVDCIYADCIYESKNFDWVYTAWACLKDNGVILVQTDYHTVGDYIQLFNELNGIFLNVLVYKQEWGGASKRFFPRKHDDIVVFAKGKDYKFRYERILIPKKTAGTALDKRGDGLKIPCDVFDDLGNFSTLSKERIKVEGKNIQWQKPLKLMDRLLLPFTDEGDLVLDPFMGSGTTGVWCKRNNRNFIGVEKDEKIFKLAEKRINNED